MSCKDYASKSMVEDQNKRQLLDWYEHCKKSYKVGMCPTWKNDNYQIYTVIQTFSLISNSWIQ